MEGFERWNARQDGQFQKPFVDVEQWRDEPVRHLYVHGGFEGSELRFAFFFPETQAYKGRFFQFMAPVQGSEDASIGRTGVEDKIGFALTHGAYFVETNMGVAVPFAPIADPTVIYRASAAAAEYSRDVARRLYGDHRPFGYIYGGSGGGFKSISCIENATAWDGAAPYVIGSPMAIPNCFTIRAHARRLLRGKLADIADALEPGGSGDPYHGLDGEQRAALEETTRLGFPLRAWFLHDIMDDGSLPVLTPAVEALDPGYYRDFWTVPGYLGAEPHGSAQRDRIRRTCKVLEVFVPGRALNAQAEDAKTGVDEAWQRHSGGASAQPWIRVDAASSDEYLLGLRIIPQTGDAAGYRFPLDSVEGDRLLIGAGFGQPDLLDKMEALRPGDELLLDNSDYLAIQTYHRHQLPDESYEGWKQFRSADGQPMYPQRPMLAGPLVAYGGAGSTQSGRFGGRMIVVASLLDESAFAWQADWYRGKVREALGDGERDRFRLWYSDNAIHDDREHTVDDLHLVSYLGALHQALLSVSNWVERGIEPPESTVYTVERGQVRVPETAAERKGIQPVVQLSADGGNCARISAGDVVKFEGQIELPPGSGQLSCADWSFEGEPLAGSHALTGTRATIKVEHVYDLPGVYFAVLRASASQNEQDTFTQVMNLARARVVVQ